jgi:hypothetical protein
LGELVEGGDASEPAFGSEVFADEREALAGEVGPAGAVDDTKAP